MRGVALPLANSWSMVTTRLLTHNVKLRKSAENIKLWLNCCPHCPKLKLGYGHLQKSQTQGGRTWQPFVGGKNGHENFRQAREH